MLCESQILVHYDSTKSVFLSCDVCQVGVGAVLCQHINDIHVPTDCICILHSFRISKELQSAGERSIHYHIWIEAFSPVISAGRSFTIIRDHRPLFSLFAPEKSAPMHTADRLERWSLILSS